MSWGMQAGQAFLPCYLGGEAAENWVPPSGLPATAGAFEDVPLGVGGRAAGTSRSKPSSAFSYKLKIFTADK